MTSSDITAVPCGSLEVTVVRCGKSANAWALYVRIVEHHQGAPFVNSADPISKSAPFLSILGSCERCGEYMSKCVCMRV